MNRREFIIAAGSFGAMAPATATLTACEEPLARLGVVIMDANPGFYPRPKTVEEIVDIVVGRCMDQAGIVHNIYRRWTGEHRD